MHSTIGPHVEAIVGWTQTTIALPLPHYFSSDTPHTKPPNAVHLIERHSRWEKQPVLVSGGEQYCLLKWPVETIVQAHLFTACTFLHRTSESLGWEVDAYLSPLPLSGGTSASYGHDAPTYKLAEGSEQIRFVWQASYTIALTMKILSVSDIRSSYIPVHVEIPCNGL